MAALVLLYLLSRVYPVADTAKPLDIGECLALRIGRAFDW